MYVCICFDILLSFSVMIIFTIENGIVHRKEQQFFSFHGSAIRQGGKADAWESPYNTLYEYLSFYSDMVQNKLTIQAI